jgi:hypothetical protein
VLGGFPYLARGSFLRQRLNPDLYVPDGSDPMKTESLKPILHASFIEAEIKRYLALIEDGACAKSCPSLPTQAGRCSPI